MTHLDDNFPGTLELIAGDNYFGIEKPSPVQQAICLAMDGLSLIGLWDDPDVRAVFGGERPPEVQPDMVLLVAASRALKSKMVSAACVKNLLTCDIGVAAPGDELRMSILGPDLDKAKPAFSNMLALISKSFPDRLAKDPLKQSLRVVRDKDKGVSIEVTLAPLTRGGSGLISRWCAGAHFTEAPRMVGEEDGSRNIDESLSALQNRMLPGAQIILEGSPWGPFGPVYDLDHKYFGKPTPGLLVIRAPGPLLWPARYTPEYCARIKEKDPKAYQADVLGQYVDPEASLIATVDIVRCTAVGVTRREPRLDEHGKLACEYVAAMDPATRGNSWTLTILGTIGLDANGGELYEQALTHEWTGTPDAPLKPWDVLTEARDICAPYGIDTALTDQASFDALADIGDRVGFGLTGLFGADGATELDVEHVRTVISEHRISLLDDPKQRTDLQRVKRRITANGSVFQLPTSGDGRHCDSIPCLGKAIRYAPPAPIKSPNRQAPPPNHSGGSSQADFARSLLR